MITLLLLWVIFAHAKHELIGRFNIKSILTDECCIYTESIVACETGCPPKFDRFFELFHSGDKYSFKCPDGEWVRTRDPYDHEYGREWFCDEEASNPTFFNIGFLGIHTDGDPMYIMQESETGLGCALEPEYWKFPDRKLVCHEKFPARHIGKPYRFMFLDETGKACDHCGDTSIPGTDPKEKFSLGKSKNRGPPAQPYAAKPSPKANLSLGTIVDGQCECNCPAILQHISDIFSGDESEYESENEEMDQPSITIQTAVPLIASSAQPSSTASASTAAATTIAGTTTVKPTERNWHRDDAGSSETGAPELVTTAGATTPPTPKPKSPAPNPPQAANQAPPNPPGNQGVPPQGAYPQGPANPPGPPGSPPPPGNKPPAPPGQNPIQQAANVADQAANDAQQQVEQAAQEAEQMADEIANEADAEVDAENEPSETLVSSFLGSDGEFYKLGFWMLLGSHIFWVYAFFHKSQETRFAQLLLEDELEEEL